ncbi:MAG: sulfatase [Planctomycetota bacterium]
MNFLTRTFVLVSISVVVISNWIDAGEKPNVLFIAVDDLNDYALGLNSSYRSKTPCLDALAERGTLFTHAYCAAPACGPSRTSVITGVAPYNSGVYLNSQDWRQNEKLWKVTTIPHHFHDHGYKVIGGGKLYHAANLSQVQLAGHFDSRPWHEYYPSKSRQLAHDFITPGQAVNGSNLFYKGRFDWNPIETADNETGDGKVVSWAEEQLSREHDQPLFLAVGIYRPHIPWYTPEKYFSLYDSSDLGVVDDPESDLDDIPDAGSGLARQAWHQWLIEQDKLDDATLAYMASSSFADAMVGRLIRALDDGPLAENTVIILWSDHGYHLGQKKHWEKFALWEQTTHVPLIFVDSRQQAQEIRCEQPVSLLDIYPTLNDLCGLGQPEHLDGQSLAPFLGDSDEPPQRAVVTTHGRNNHAVRSSHWRYIRYADGSEELYDHRNDAREIENLAGAREYQLVIERLAEHLPRHNEEPRPRTRWRSSGLPPDLPTSGK